ncbi:Transcription repressor OFP4 [Ananas comosus]|uniref:Transcription repressor n=1 Tax=Ananas comosus TaxID=4615 RepID=A0A199UPV0_ANACO|nr:Transcription repressor OFP4 [Ananas comosus]
MKGGSKKGQRSPKITAKRCNSQAHTSSSSSPPPPTPPKPPPPPPPPPPPNTFYLPNRASYYFPSKDMKLTNPPTTHFPTDPPRKSKSKKFSAKKLTRASPKIASSVSTSASNKPEPAPDTRPFDRDVYTEDDDHRRKTIIARSLESQSFSVTTSATDIVFDVGKPMELPPILTKPTKRQADKPRSDHKRRSLSRIRVRPGSPRLARSKTEAKQRKGFMESFVVVKSSSDPQRDFQESMVEMIVENDIQSSKDLEELLACYLALNSREYHAVIVKVFEQIWIHLNNATL